MVDLQSLPHVSSSLLGTLLKTKVPRCKVTHEEEQSRRQDCVWPCQIKAIVDFTTDLSIKLQQRSFNTFFQWPESGEGYDKCVMEAESDLRSNAVVDMTYMPAVIDEHDWKDPRSLDQGVSFAPKWLKPKGSYGIGHASRLACLKRYLSYPYNAVGS
jgi:hypothetical protein